MISRRVPGRLSVAMAGIVLCLMVLLAACNTSTGQTGFSPPAPQPTATLKPPVVYVALGASDAVGVGADDPNTQGYVPLIIARLPKNSSPLNLGISGITLDQALSVELPQAVADHPSLITVWLAANDFRACVSATQYASELESLLSQLQSQTSARVFVANLPDLSLLPAMQPGTPGFDSCPQEWSSSSDMHAQVLVWNAAIAAAVTANHDYLVDLFNSTLATHPEYISGDGFHPSSQGYAALADLFWAQIEAHGNLPQG